VKKENKKLSSEELFAFSDEMHMMIQSGISAVEAITLMLEESQNTYEKDLLKQMQDTIYDKGSFAAAVRDAKVFPEYYTHMIEIGEQTGKTDEVLRTLANHYEREVAIHHAIKSAVSYPLLMVSMMLVIIIVLVTCIMPIFERVFRQLGSDMDGVSGGLLQLGQIFVEYRFLFLALLFIIVASVLWMFKTASGRKFLLNLISKISFFNRIYEKIMVSRFCSAMAMTISSGMSLPQALDIAGNLVTSIKIQKKIQICKDKFTESTDIGNAFSQSGLFTGLYGRMVVLAAKTGNMEQVMDKVANTYQDEADEEIHSLIAIVEPTLVIILSVIVGLILMSVMLPLLNIMAGMN